MLRSPIRYEGNNPTDEILPLVHRVASVIPARYAQVADCTASDVRARLPDVFPALRFAELGAGIATSAATVAPMATQLASSGTWCQSATEDDIVTTAARAKRRTPANRAARTGLRARHADTRAKAHSTAIQTRVISCSRTIRRDNSPGAPHPLEHPLVTFSAFS